MTNPLLTNTPVPAYDQMRYEHFEPAFDLALAKAQAEFAAIRDCTDLPTFENTVVALEKLCAEFGYIMSSFAALHLAGSNPESYRIENAISQKIADFSKDVYQDQVMGARFDAVYKSVKNLDAEDQELLQDTYLEFEEEGAFLSAAGQSQLKSIDSALIDACSKFSENESNAAEQQAVHITDAAELAGLEEGDIAAMAKNAQQKNLAGWLYIPERLQVDSLLAQAQSRSFRQKIFEALNRLGTQEPYNNEPVIKDILRLRHEKAQLLGYQHYADFSMARTMTGTLAAAQAYLKQTSDAVLPVYEAEIQKIEAFSAQNGGPASFEPWDLPYWEAQYTAATYKFDPKDFEPYLELENVLDGFFKDIEDIYGLRLQATTSYPLYHPDVKTYEAFDTKTNELVGILYTDFYQRAAGTPDKKNSGAWMMDLQHAYEKDGVKHPCIASINDNYMQPEPGKKRFLSLDNFETLYHEGGHAMHGLMGSKTKYESRQGPAAPPDFVEIHSNLLQQIASDKESLKSRLRHYQTGAPIPDALVDAMIQAGRFGAMAGAMKVVQNSTWDFAAHTMDPRDFTSSKDLQNANWVSSKYAALIRPYPFTRFTHIMDSPGTGYAAGYYGYLTSIIKAVAGFATLKSDPNAKDRIRTFYSRGSAEDLNRMFETYNGGPATIDAYLQAMGITPPKKPLPAPKAAPVPQP